MQVNRKNTAQQRRSAKEWATPYLQLARWHQPTGTWLLLWPCGWSLALASAATSQSFPDIRLLVLFAIGALVMRSAGCVVNDLWDQKIDAQVTRTRSRPLASGALSRKQAALFLLLLLLVALMIALQLNQATFLLALLSLPLVGLYPAMKRITWWPQAFLGLTFNFGALMGWTAVTGEPALPALFLYAAGIFWTLGYDTIYAHQDAEDDALIGVKSTARLFGRHSRRWVSGFYLLMITGLALAGVLAGEALITLLFLPFISMHLLWQLWQFNPQDTAKCLFLFKSNLYLGGLVFAGFLATCL